jgi:hypothetical protein
MQQEPWSFLNQEQDFCQNLHNILTHYQPYLPPAQLLYAWGINVTELNILGGMLNQVCNMARDVYLQFSLTSPADRIQELGDSTYPMK